MQQGGMDIVVKYCATWGHQPNAVSLTDEILNERDIEYFISSWKLIPSTGGVFDVTVNGELVFSKHAVGRHAEPGEVRDGILKVLETVRPPDFELVSK